MGWPKREVYTKAPFRAAPSWTAVRQLLGVGAGGGGAEAGGGGIGIEA
jgi:hypothetical protein